MATSQTRLEVLIKSVADVTGFKMTEAQAQKLTTTLGEAERAAMKAAQATKGVGTSAAGGAKKLGDFQKAGTDASTMLGGLERASRGGIDGIIGIASAFRGFIGLVRSAVAASGPLGLLVTALGLAAGAMLALSGRSKEAAQSIEDVKKQAQDLAKQSLDNLNRQIAAAGETADETRGKFERLQAAAEKLDNAEQARRLAEIRANTNLSDEQRAQAEADIRRTYANRADDRQKQALNEEVRRLESQAEAANTAAARPELEYRYRVQARERLEKQEQDAARLADLRRQRVVLTNERSPDSLRRANELGTEITALEEATRGFSPEALAAAREREEAAKGVANTARARQAEAAGRVRVARELRDEGLGQISRLASERNLEIAAEESGAVRAARQKASTPAAPNQNAQVGREIENLVSARQKEVQAIQDSIRAEEERRFRLPALSPEVDKIDGEIERLKTELEQGSADYEAKLSALQSRLVEAPKAVSSALDKGGSELVTALDTFATKLSTAAQAAAAKIAAVPVGGSGGTMVMADGTTVNVPASSSTGSGGSVQPAASSPAASPSASPTSSPDQGGQTTTPAAQKPTGSITRGEQVISVPQGDPNAVAKALGQYAQKQDEANAATLAVVTDMTRKAALQERQISNMRERSSP